MLIVNQSVVCTAQVSADNAGNNIMLSAPTNANTIVIYATRTGKPI
jgi:hypothetical protein